MIGAGFLRVNAGRTLVLLLFQGGRPQLSRRKREDKGDRSVLGPLLLGAAMGAAATVIYRSLRDDRDVDPFLIARRPHDKDLPPVVVVPGICGSELIRPDGTVAWLNMGSAFGSHDLSLPLKLPLSESRDDLRPGGLLGVDTLLPRLFGFSEYAELLELLDRAGFVRDPAPGDAGPAYHVFTYDWRRDLHEAVCRLDATLEELADLRKDPSTRFSLIGHSMGGLVARYYLRYGTADPAANPAVTWGGARRIASLILVGTPSGGSLPSLDAILNGNRIGLSSTTMAPHVVARCPSVYVLLPPRGVSVLIDHRGDPLDAELHDIATWKRFGWGPFQPQPDGSRAGDAGEERELQQAFLKVVLERAAQIHRSFAREPESECPCPVYLLGGDCLPTLARIVVPKRRGASPLFDPRTRIESRLMFEAGDGRVIRASALAAHLATRADGLHESGIPELEHAFFGAADHHGFYGEPTFQSLLLRILFRSGRRPKATLSVKTADASPLEAAAVAATSRG